MEVVVKEDRHPSDSIPRRDWPRVLVSNKANSHPIGTHGKPKVETLKVEFLQPPNRDGGLCIGSWGMLFMRGVRLGNVAGLTEEEAGEQQVRQNSRDNFKLGAPSCFNCFELVLSAKINSPFQPLLRSGGQKRKVKPTCVNGGPGLDTPFLY
jgi:hypothetical protein